MGRKDTPNYCIAWELLSQHRSISKYLAMDLEACIRINGLSAGPVKTLAGATRFSRTEHVYRYLQENVVASSIKLSEISNSAFCTYFLIYRVGLLQECSSVDGGLLALLFQDPNDYSYSYLFSN